MRPPEINQEGRTIADGYVNVNFMSDSLIRSIFEHEAEPSSLTKGEEHLK